jgi:hypothetical protein
MKACFAFFDWHIAVNLSISMADRCQFVNFNPELELTSKNNRLKL